MKLTVSKDQLLKSLADIQGIVERKSTMPVLNHFLFDCSGESPVLYATDLETAIRETIDLRPLKKGVLAIPAKTFISFVKELEGDITLEAGENFSLTISSGKITLNLACLDPKEFPAWPEVEDGTELSLSAALLRALIEKTVYAASDSDTRYVFNGILLHIQGKALTAVGTDGHRLALYRSEIPDDLPGIKVILPKKSVSELKKLVENQTVSIKIGKNHVLVRTAHLEFLTKVIEGTYPNYEQVIPKSSQRRLKVLKTDFEKALRRVSIISRERSHAVKFDMKDDSLVVSASNPDLGSAEEVISVIYEGEPFTIGFNAKYILDALGAIENDEVIMEFNDPLGPSLIKGYGDEGYLCVIMPMRI